MEYKVCNIKGLEGLYHIYENGDIYSIVKKRLLKRYVNNSYKPEYSYYYAVLQNNGVSVRTGIHRIVAHHFIQPIIGIDTNLEVNHKDLDKSNNHVSNLELVTHQQNILHARQGKYWDNGRKGFKVSESTKEKMSKKKMKKIVCYNENQELIFNSIQEFMDFFNTHRKTFNRYVNNYKAYKGFYIRYAHPF